MKNIMLALSIFAVKFLLIIAIIGDKFLLHLPFIFASVAGGYVGYGIYHEFGKGLAIGIGLIVYNTSIVAIYCTKNENRIKNNEKQN